MKKATWMLAILMMAFVAIQGVAFAELVNGKVLGIDNDAKSISINQQDPATGALQEVKVLCKADTGYQGCNALADVKVGDEVSVEAEQDPATGDWWAKAVTVAAAAAQQ